MNFSKMSQMRYKRINENLADNKPSGYTQPIKRTLNEGGFSPASITRNIDVAKVRPYVIDNDLSVDFSPRSLFGYSLEKDIKAIAGLAMVTAAALVVMPFVLLYKLIKGGAKGAHNRLLVKIRKFIPYTFLGERVGGLPAMEKGEITDIAKKQIALSSQAYAEIKEIVDVLNNKMIDRIKTINQSPDYKVLADFMASSDLLIKWGSIRGVGSQSSNTPPNNGTYESMQSDIESFATSLRRVMEHKSKLVRSFRVELDRIHNSFQEFVKTDIVKRIETSTTNYNVLLDKYDAKFKKASAEKYRSALRKELQMQIKSSHRFVDSVVLLLNGQSNDEISVEAIESLYNKQLKQATDPSKVDHTRIVIGESHQKMGKNSYPLNERFMYEGYLNEDGESEPKDSYNYQNPQKVETEEEYNKRINPQPQPTPTPVDGTAPVQDDQTKQATPTPPANQPTTPQNDVFVDIGNVIKSADIPLGYVGEESEEESAPQEDTPKSPDALHQIAIKKINLTIPESPHHNNVTLSAANILFVKNAIDEFNEVVQRVSQSTNFVGGRNGSNQTNGLRNMLRVLTEKFEIGEGFFDDIENRTSSESTENIVGGVGNCIDEQSEKVDGDNKDGDGKDGDGKDGKSTNPENGENESDQTSGYSISSLRNDVEEIDEFYKMNNVLVEYENMVNVVSSLNIERENELAKILKQYAPSDKDFDRKMKEVSKLAKKELEQVDEDVKKQLLEEIESEITLSRLSYIKINVIPSMLHATSVHSSQLYQVIKTNINIEFFNWFSEYSKHFDEYNNGSNPVIPPESVDAKGGYVANGNVTPEVATAQQKMVEAASITLHKYTLTAGENNSEHPLSISTNLGATLPLIYDISSNGKKLYGLGYAIAADPQVKGDDDNLTLDIPGQGLDDSVEERITYKLWTFIIKPMIQNMGFNRDLPADVEEQPEGGEIKESWFKKNGEKKRERDRKQLIKFTEQSFVDGFENLRAKLLNYGGFISLMESNLDEFKKQISPLLENLHVECLVFPLNNTNPTEQDDSDGYDEPTEQPTSEKEPEAEQQKRVISGQGQFARNPNNQRDKIANVPKPKQKAPQPEQPKPEQPKPVQVDKPSDDSSQNAGGSKPSKQDRLDAYNAKNQKNQSAQSNTGPQKRKGGRQGSHKKRIVDSFNVFNKRIMSYDAYKMFEAVLGTGIVYSEDSDISALVKHSAQMKRTNAINRSLWFAKGQELYSVPVIIAQSSEVDKFSNYIEDVYDIPNSNKVVVVLDNNNQYNFTHSIDPNVQGVYIKNGNCVSYKALRNINKGEQLTVNMDGKKAWWTDKELVENAGQDGWTSSDSFCSTTQTTSVV